MKNTKKFRIMERITKHRDQATTTRMIKKLLATRYNSKNILQILEEENEH